MAVLEVAPAAVRPVYTCTIGKAHQHTLDLQATTPKEKMGALARFASICQCPVSPLGVGQSIRLYSP